MCCINRTRTLFWLLPCVLIAAGAAHAQTTYYVDDGGASTTCTGWDDACPDLQTALGLAVSGDQIWVATGTYVGNFTLALGVELYGGFVGNETELTQRDWEANATILDGNHSGTVVTSPSGATATTRVDGFTITNGIGGDGGGLYLLRSSPTIANNTITGNHAPCGAGLYLLDSYPTIANNTIVGNSALSIGGGLYLLDSSPTITNNTITGNEAYEGGGLYLRDYSSPMIADNTITANRASFTGGGLYVESSSPTIANNTITGNNADDYGGGLYLHDSSPTIANNTITANGALWGGGLYLKQSSPTIANNTITGNNASGGGGLYLRYSSPTIANNTITANGACWGGALYLWESSPTIANNTITGNSASSAGGGLYLYWDSSPTIANTIVAFNSSGIFRDTGTPTLRYNCVFGNTEYDYYGVTDPTGTDGNISTDPRLADPRYGNVHIQPDSPCVNSGSNADAFGDFDMDNELRIQRGTVDIGADESDGTVWPAGPYVTIRVSPAGDDANDGSSWALAKRTVQAGIDAASALGGEVWVQGGTYEEFITLHLYAYVYGGFAGSETARDERDWDANVTTLDGQQQGSVVTAEGGYRVNAIDGFTITNGSAEYGGGLNLRYSSPTIANNTIAGNSASSGGGGLSLYHSSSTIVNNTITANRASFAGGGLFLQYSSATIANNTITGNNADHYGGGLFLEYSSPILGNNTIAVNNALVGGGLFLAQGSPTIANNAITGNSAPLAGGLGLYYDSSPTIANTIVAFNSSGILRNTGTPTLRYNCVYGNTAYDYDGLSDPTGTGGNIAADPMFVQNPDPGPDGLWGTADDDPGDLPLLSGSPCIDAGDNDDVPRDTPDLDGDSDTEEPLPLDLGGGPRFLDHPTSPDTGNPGVIGPPIVDMGPYENPRDCNENGYPDDCDIDCAALDGACDIPGCGASGDCNANAVPDECDITEETSEDLDVNGIPDECECVTIAEPLQRPDGEAGYSKSRYISFVPGHPGEFTALRVTLLDLPAPFDIHNGTTMWVAEPITEVSENAGKIDPVGAPGFGTFWSAKLSCDPPEYRDDWSTKSPLHVIGDAIVPGATYEVQAIHETCDVVGEPNYSAPLVVSTSHWGDSVGHCAVIPCTPPEGVVNITTDVTACLDKFRNLEGAVLKSRADIEPNYPDWLVNIADVTYVLDAFRGFAYPPAQAPPAPGWPGPDGCP